MDKFLIKLSEKAKYIYLINLVICSFIPLFLDYFPTHDGLTHLYNAFVAKKIMFDNDLLFTTFFDINLNMQPNILVHLIMVILVCFLKPIIVQKITLSLIILTLGFGFKFFLNKVSKNSGMISLLFLPFLYNVILFWGFYNFLFGLGLAFFFIGKIEKIDILKLKYFEFISLSILLFSIVLSHPLPFLLVGLYTLLRLFITIDFHSLKKNVITLGKIFLLFIPSLFFLLNFLLKQNSSTTFYEENYSWQNRFNYLTNFESLKFIGYAESNYLLVMYIILFFLVGLTIYQTLRKQKSFKYELATKLTFSFLLMLFCLFIPFGSAGGDIVPLRFYLFFNISLVIVVSLIDLNKLTSMTILLFWLISIPLFIMRIQFANTCSKMFSKLNQFNSLIENSSIICSDFIENPKKLHRGYELHSYIDFFRYSVCYSAIESKSIVLNNFGLGTLSQNSYLALAWKNQNLVPKIIHDKINNTNNINIIDYNIKSIRKIDFILSFGESDSNKYNGYVILAQDEDYPIKLYKKKEN